jgi:hypothetical protein
VAAIERRRRIESGRPERTVRHVVHDRRSDLPSVGGRGRAPGAVGRRRRRRRIDVSVSTGLTSPVGVAGTGHVRESARSAGVGGLGPSTPGNQRKTQIYLQRNVRPRRGLTSAPGCPKLVQACGEQDVVRRPTSRKTPPTKSRDGSRLSRANWMCRPGRAVDHRQVTAVSGNHPATALEVFWLPV